MTIENIQAICKSLPAVTEDIKWDTHLCFCVGEKIFIITSPDSVPQTASFKVSDEDFELLQERNGFTPAAYLARYKWIYVDDISKLSREEWEHYLKLAYEIVAAKLPVKKKKMLGLI